MNDTQWNLDTNRIKQETADAIFFAEVTDFEAEDSEVRGNSVIYFDEQENTLTITFYLSGVTITRDGE